MSRITEMTELKLAALVAVSTMLGGVGTTFVGRLLPDVSTERQTDAQVIQVAIGILSAPIEPGDRNNASKDAALRMWAVDTINSVSSVKFPKEARDSLIRGETQIALLVPAKMRTAEMRSRDQALAHSLERAAEGAILDLEDAGEIKLEVYSIEE